MMSIKSGIAASLVKKPTKIKLPHTISTMPTNGAITCGAGIPILMKRPTPSESETETSECPRTKRPILQGFVQARPLLQCELPRMCQCSEPCARLPAAIQLSRNRARRKSSDVVEKTHEPVIHVQLLVTVEQRQPGIVRCEVYFDFLIAADHHNVLQHARCRLTCKPSQLEAVPVKMNRMDVVASIAHVQTIAAALP